MAQEKSQLVCLKSFRQWLDALTVSACTTSSLRQSKKWLNCSRVFLVKRALKLLIPHYCSVVDSQIFRYCFRSCVACGPLFCSIVLLIVPGIFMKTCSVYYVHYTSISVVLSVAKYCKVSISCMPYIGLHTINRETRVRLQTLIIKKKMIKCSCIRSCNII